MRWLKENGNCWLEFNLRVVFPSKSDYHLALIISTVVLNNKLKLVTKDKHFFLVREVKKSFKVDVV
jgi:hypothetical protein